MAKRFVGSFPNPRCTGSVRSLFYNDDEAGHAQAEAFAQRENTPGRAVYDAVNLFRDDADRRNVETVEGIIRIACDIDLKDVEEDQDTLLKKLTSLPYPPSEIRASGHGVHAIWTLKEPVSVADPTEAAKVRELRTRCTEWLCADPSINHDAALLRRPGTTNSKDPGNPAICSVVAACGATYDPCDIADLLDDCAAQPLLTAKGNAESDAHDPFNSPKPEGEWREPVDIDAAFASMKDGFSVNRAQPSIIASLLMRGGTPDEVIERVVDETMAMADQEGLGWDREFEVHAVTTRCTSALGFLQGKHDWSETTPPWLPADHLHAWAEKQAEGKRPYFTRNGHGWHVRGYPRREPPQQSNVPHEGTAEEARQARDGDTIKSRKPRVILKPFAYINPADLPPRHWLYGGHLQRRIVSADVAPGGVGKTSKGLVEAIALATTRKLLGEQPEERCRVWVHNGEDNLLELNRRVLAICQYYGIEQKELEAWLFLSSGTEMPLKVANGYNELRIDAPLVDEITKTILDNQIDLFLVDPLVTLHSVPESDNGKMDQVIRIFTRIADTCDCAINITHHTRKLAAGETTHTSDDARGAAHQPFATQCAACAFLMSCHWWKQAD